MKKTTGSEPRRRTPKKNGTLRWRCRLEDYHDLVDLEFPTEKDTHAALELVWVGRLMGMPFDLNGNGGLVVPKIALPYFKEAGIKFTLEKRP